MFVVLKLFRNMGTPSDEFGLIRTTTPLRSYLGSEPFGDKPIVAILLYVRGEDSEESGDANAEVGENTNAESGENADAETGEDE